MILKVGSFLIKEGRKTPKELIKLRKVNQNLAKLNSNKMD